MLITDKAPTAQKHIGLYDVFTFKGQEYLVVKVNSVNNKIFCLNNQKTYNLSRIAKVSDVRQATLDEVKIYKLIENSKKANKVTAATDTGTFKLGQTVQILPQYATPTYPSSKKWTVIKLNSKTMKLAEITNSCNPMIINTSYSIVTAG